MELNSSSEKASDLASKFEKLPKEMIVNKSKPQSSKKYPQRHLKEWGQLGKLYHKWKAFHAFLRSSAEDVLMELNGKVEKEPSVLSEGFPLFSLACKKGTKSNACDDPSNVKKQAKVDLHRFVTTKLQASYAWLWKVWNFYWSNKLYFVFIARLLTWRRHPRPMTLHRVRLPGQFARRRDSHYFCLCFAPF